MSRLFLASPGFGSQPSELLRLVDSGTRAAVVLNALDGEGPRPAHELALNIGGLRDMGIDADELDLRDYFGDPAGLERSLGGVGLVWVAGGNTFVLRRALRASGLDAVARRRAHSGSLVWGGFSAGAAVAAPTLAGIEVIDDPDEAPAGYTDVPIEWAGLGLFPERIAPHFVADRPEHPIAELVRRFEADGATYRTLADGEALVLRDGVVHRVGAPDSRDSTG